MAPQPPDPVRNEDGSFRQPPNNVVHDQAKLRIRNSGDQPLTINSLTPPGFGGPGRMSLFGGAFRPR